VNKYELVAFIITLPTIAVTIITVVTLYFRRARQEPSRLSAATDERLARIEQAVDSIAVEVERISEAQRFSARLLAEGRRPDALPARTPSEGHARG